MTVDASALVLVQPDDTIETVIAKVRESGATNVQLLIPEGTTALQKLSGFAELRLMFDRRQMRLQVISPDQKVLNAARRNEFEIVGVEGVSIATKPIGNGGSRKSYATRSLPAAPDTIVATPSVPAADEPELSSPHSVAESVDLDARPSTIDEPKLIAPPSIAEPLDLDARPSTIDESEPPASPTLVEPVDTIVYPSSDAEAAESFDTTPTAHPIADHDAEFLSALDSMPAGERYTAEDDPARSGSPDATRAAPGAREPADDDIARRLAEYEYDIDDLSDQPIVPIERPIPRRRTRSGLTDTGMRVMPSEETLRRSGARTTGSTDALARRERITQSGRRIPYERDEPRRNPLLAIVPLLLLIAIAGIAVAWVMTNRVTVTVAPPPQAIQETSFQNEIIPYVAPDAGQDVAAVVAMAVTAEAEATVQGRAVEQLTPVGVARGTLRIINALAQPIDLPQGTEFVATNAEGQEVRFLIDAPATVPPSTTTPSLTGSVTRFGEIEVQVSARSPGSGSNVGENSITQVLVPGQAPIQNSQTFNILNQPLTGGDEQNVFVVTEEAVFAVLGEALTQLYDNGVQQLNDQTSGGLVADSTTVSPNKTDLANPASYEPPVVSPAVGEPVDPSNPVFSVTVRTRFNALATPPDQPLEAQVNTVVPERLARRGELPCSGDELGFSVAGWNWSAQQQQLTANGTITCTPRGALSEAAISQVRNAVRGQSRAAAEESLAALQRANVIGAFELPEDKIQFTNIDLLITVQEARPGGAPTAAPDSSPTAQPTQGT
jgi:hypothetical protein